jgi:diguanylate cyclase (GGDEF)-like protein
MAGRSLQRPERRAGAPAPEGAISNLPQSFARQVWDKLRDHLAEAIAVAIFAALAAGYVMFLTRMQAAEARLEELRVSGLNAIIAAAATGALAAIATGLLVRSRFRRIADDLRHRIAGMERESALEQPNEQKVRAAVEAAIASASETGEDLALVLVDIDDFRRLNNDYSYDIGTFVLRQCARLLSSNIRGSRDRVMRYFERGDEFLIILPGTGVEDAYQAVAERLRKLVKDNRFILSDDKRYRGEFCELTISAGVTAYAAGEDWSAVRDRIVTALHDAKDHGKDRCVRILPDHRAHDRSGNQSE